MINKLFRRQKRASGIIPVMLLALGIMVVAVHWTFAATGSTAICKWKDNKQAALSISVDDVPLVGNCTDYAAVVNPRGIKMTFYVMCDLMDSFWGTWSDLDHLVTAGHELGIHPYGYNGQSGTASDESTPEVYRAKLQTFKSVLEQKMPGNGKCLTMAWHYSRPTKPENQIIEPDYVIANRGDTPFANPSSPSLDPLAGNCSMFQLGSGHGWCYVYGLSGTYMMVDAALMTGGWTCPYWHSMDITSGSDCSSGACDFTAYCDYIYSKRESLWTGTIREVAQYIYERDSSAVQVVSSDSAQIILNLTHSLPMTICDFDFPLTLKTEVDPGWDSVTVTQGGGSAGVTAVDEAGTKYVYFDARPNQGHITLTAAGTVAITEAPKPVLDAALVRPNPLNAGLWNRYRQQDPGTVICDLGGNKIDRNRRLRPGVYLVAPAGQSIRQVLVVE